LRSWSRGLAGFGRLPLPDRRGGPGRLVGTSFTRRALLLGLAQAGGLGVLGARLYELQVMEARRYAPLADDNRLDVEVLAPVRGRILDRSGTVLAANEESFHVALRTGRGGNVRESLDRLSRIVSLPPAEREAMVERARKHGIGTPLVLARDLTFEQVAAINLEAPQLPGIETGTTYRRKYVQGLSMGHLTGYVGRVEEHAIDDAPMLRLDWVKVGKAGAERGFETVLRGTGGSRKFEVDAHGRIIRNLEEMEPVAGRDVILAADLALQTRVVERLQREGRAALVVLDVVTGEITALASVPTYDPAVLTERLTPAAWKALAQTPDRSLLNRAVGGLYPPGSTFKMVTALAALEAGKVSLDERIECRGSFDLADKTFRCWKRHGHGRCDFHRALRESCDVYFYEIANRTGINAIAAMGRKLGLGQVYDCGLPLQKRGVVPDADWKKTRYRAIWLAGETVLAGIGQGYVLTSPLQLAVMTARIATGRAVVPRLERLDPRIASPGNGAAPLGISETSLEAVRRAMVAVVNEDGGTGGNARPASGRVLAAGKTGTSQVVANSLRIEDGSPASAATRDHALFVSYFPAQSPRYAIVAVVENGGGGGATAAPLVADVIEYIVADDPASRPYPGAPAHDADTARHPIERG